MSVCKDPPTWDRDRRGTGRRQLFPQTFFLLWKLSLRQMGNIEHVWKLELAFPRLHHPLHTITHCFSCHSSQARPQFSTHPFH